MRSAPWRIGAVGLSGFLSRFMLVASLFACLDSRLDQDPDHHFVKMPRQRSCSVGITQFCLRSIGPRRTRGIPTYAVVTPDIAVGYHAGMRGIREEQNVYEKRGS